jgi:hypothetical protein
VGQNVPLDLLHDGVLGPEVVVETSGQRRGGLADVAARGAGDAQAAPALPPAWRRWYV